MMFRRQQRPPEMHVSQRRMDDWTDDEEGGPVVSIVRSPMPGNFVPPAPLATRQPQTIDAPAWLTQGQPLDVGAAWQPQQGAKEATSAVDRAKGLQLRLWPFLVLYGAAGAVVGGAVWLVAASVPIAALGAVLTFAALGVGPMSS